MTKFEMQKMGAAFTCMRMHTPSEACAAPRGETNESSRYLQTCVYMLLESVVLAADTRLAIQSIL